MKATISILVLGLTCQLFESQLFAVESDYITIPDELHGFKVERLKLHGGKQEGVELLVIDNGLIQVRLIPIRGMSVLDVRDSKTGEVVLGWKSPVKEVVHPKFIQLESRGGLGWLEGFNEWMVRCGLEFAGHPGTDEFTTNTGDTGTLTLTLHGKIGNIPASSVKVFTSDHGKRLHVQGTVYESFFYGPKLKLETELSVTRGKSEIEFNDRVTNLGASVQEFQLIYHMNFGSPILEEGAKVIVPIKKIEPMNDQAAKAINRHATYEGPTQGFIEEVFLIHPYANDAGTSLALLHDKAKKRGAVIKYNVNQLPYLTIWKNTTALEDGYVTGIEPATGFPFNRKVERKFDRVPKLKPGQSRSFSIITTILNSNDEIAESIQTVKSIQAGRKTTVVPTPPEID